MSLKPLLNLLSDRVWALPVAVLYITDGCNSRCVTCDIWKLPRRNMELSLVQRLVDELPGVRMVALSGGEAMQHPEWPTIAAMFRAAGAKVNLITNGLALKKRAAEVIDNIDMVTVSLDGATPETYKAIRGIDALSVVLEGIQAVSKIPVTTRTTIQRRNFRELAAIIDVAKSAGAHKISFLGVDVSNMAAFGPRDHNQIASPALTPDELPEFAAILDLLEQTHAEDFKSGRIAESSAKLRRLHRYFAAINGLATFDGPRCNAPHMSVVIGVDGTLQPCYFLPEVGKINGQPITEALNAPQALELREAYRTGQRQECERCVCPLYLGPRTLLNEWK